MARMTQAELEAHEARMRSVMWKSIGEHDREKLAAALESRDDRAEKVIQQEIEDWLRTLGNQVWWSRSRMDQPTTNREGVPDFLMCFNGWFLAVEVKKPGKKPTTKQRDELGWIRAAGGVECVATSLGEVKALFELLQARKQMAETK